MKEDPFTFANTAAHRLTLWRVSAFSTFTNLCLRLSCKVSVLSTTQLMNEVAKKQFLVQDPLLAAELLSGIFLPPGPAQGTNHIVVKLPPARESSLPWLCMSDEHVAIIADRGEKRMRYEEGGAVIPSSSWPHCCNCPFEYNTLSCYSTRRLGSSKTDANPLLLSKHLLATNLPLWYANGMTRRDSNPAREVHAP